MVRREQPVTPTVETIRALLLGTPMGDAPWWAIGWCILILAIAVAWGAWLFRREVGRR